MVTFKELRNQDIRQNIRVDDKRRLIWHLQDSDIKGQGRIYNISTSGMLLETNGLFIPHDRCVFSFTTNLGIGNYVPSQGRVVWSKRKKGKANRYLCGVKFVEPAGFVLSKLHKKVDSGLKKAKAIQVTEKTSNVLIFSGIIALTGIVIWLANGIYQDMVTTNKDMMIVSEQQASLTRNYANLYQTTQIKLEETQLNLQSALDELSSTRQLYQQSQVLLTGVNQELEATKAILVETEAMLASARQGAIDSANLSETQLAQVQTEMEKTRLELMNTIALLEEKNIQLTGEMNVVNGKLQYYEGNVKDLAEGRSLINLYRQKMKEVKRKVSHFNREAHLARQTAMREQDRIRAILGNNGYFVKDGLSVKVDQAMYESGTLRSSGSSDAGTISTPKPTVNAGKNVKIDVIIVD